MDFNSRLKGKVTQSLVECLLEDSGLQIMPLGIETVVREVKMLTQAQYLATGISKNLRTLPDFFVCNSDMSQTWLLEVKYRRQWDEDTRRSIFSGIKDQVFAWQPLILAIFLGEAGHGTNTPASFVRLVRLTIHKGQVCKIIPAYTDGLTDEEFPETYIPWDKLSWLALERIQDVFPSLSDRFEANTLTKAVGLIKRLTDIDLFED